MIRCLYLKLRNIRLHNVTHSLISHNLRGTHFRSSSLTLIVTFLSLPSLKPPKKSTHTLALRHVSFIQSVAFLFLLCYFFFLCHLLDVGACVRHIVHKGQVEWTNIKMLHFVLFHSDTCYTSSTVSRIHVNVANLCIVMCTLVSHVCDTTEFRVMGSSLKGHFTHEPRAVPRDCERPKESVKGCPKTSPKSCIAVTDPRV
jgi:hypothetical protein